MGIKNISSILTDRTLKSSISILELTSLSSYTHRPNQAQAFPLRHARVRIFFKYDADLMLSQGTLWSKIIYAETTVRLKFISPPHIYWPPFWSWGTDLQKSWGHRSLGPGPSVGDGDQIDPQWVVGDSQHMQYPNVFGSSPHDPRGVLLLCCETIAFYCA